MDVHANMMHTMVYVGNTTGRGTRKAVDTTTLQTVWHGCCCCLTVVSLLCVNWKPKRQE